MSAREMTAEEEKNEAMYWDVQKLKEVTKELREREAGIHREPSIKELASGLAKAQAKIKPPVKNRTVDFQPERGPRVKYSYADLADVIAAIAGPLGENGLSFTHILTGTEKTFGMKTILMHSSGESISTWYPLPDPLNMKPQTFGSALTYARRYSISALVGIASDEDDDGQTEAHDKAPDKKPAPRPAAAPAKAAGAKNEAPASKTQIEQINMLAQDRGIPPGELGAFIKNCYPGVNSKNMKRWVAEEIISLFEDKDTTAATVMARVAKAQLNAEVNQAPQERYAPGTQ